MKTLLGRAVYGILGMGIVLAWWTWGPHHDVHTASQKTIPARFGPGGHQLEIDAETTTPATMQVSFEDLSKAVGQQIMLNSSEKISAGMRSWTVDVPAGIGGYIELDTDHPSPGDTITMRVHLDGHLVDEQSDKLDQPLPPNTAFFVQDHFDDYSKAAEEARLQ